MNRKIMILAVLGLLLLGGCSAAAPQEPSSAAAPTAAVQPQESVAPGANLAESEPPAPTAAPAENAESTETGGGEPSVTQQNKAAAQNELVTLLDTMEQEVPVDAPGSQTDTVRIAASLMNWGVGTELTADEVRQITLDWLMNKGDAEGAAINQKFAAVDAVYQSLLGDGGAEIIAAAEAENAAYPWSDEPLETVEAIMNAVGLR